MKDIMSEATIYRSTDHVALPERERYWRELVTDTFVELDCSARAGSKFSASLRSRQLGELEMAEVMAAPQTVVRSRSQVRRSHSDWCLINFQIRGSGKTHQCGRVATLDVGDFALFDTAQPYDLAFDQDFGQLVLKVPRQAVTSRFSRLTDVTSIAVKGSAGMGAIVSQMAQRCWMESPYLSGRGPLELQSALLDLCLAAIGEQVDERSHATLAQSPNALKERIYRYIDLHLKDSDLSVAQIAEAHAISTRYVRKLFEGSDYGVRGWILRQRLENARRELLQSRSAKPMLTQLAYKWGFKDAAHFSRAFKHAFGQSPRAYYQSRA